MKNPLRKTAVLKDPLVHFLVLGALMFAAFAWRGGAGESAPAERIVIGAERVEELARAANLVQGREPTRAELEALVEPMIREEMFYREALALGLDENDDEVRRRLVEKMQYLTQDLADPEPASEQALREFFEAEPALFRIPPAVTFEQVFFSPRERGDALEGDVESALARLTAGAEPGEVGDSTPLMDRYVAAPREQVEVLFGEALADALFAELEPGAWTGPHRSDFGLHLVRLLERTAARRPGFEEAREQALRLYAQRERERVNQAQIDAMRARYDIVVEWPEETAAQ